MSLKLLESACAVDLFILKKEVESLKNWPSNTLTPPILGTLGLAAHKENEQEVIMSPCAFLLAQLGEDLKNFLKHTHTQTSTKVCNRLE